MAKKLTATGLPTLLQKIAAAFVKISDTATATAVNVDSAPTASSSNLVTSGGVKAALDAKQDTISASNKLNVSLVSVTVGTSVPSVLALNQLYDLGQQTSISLILPASASVGDFMEVDFVSGTTATTLSISSDAGMTDCDIVPETGKIYKMFFAWGKLDATTYGWVISYAEFEKEA